MVSNEEQTNPEVEPLVDELATEDNATEAEPELSLEAKVEQLEEQLQKTKDDALRTLADAQNIKRRAEQDIDKARKFALEKFATDLLAVADNMQRAIDAADKENEDLKPLVEGVELTQKALADTFAKHSVQELNPVGEPFDPAFHQAISMVENPDVEPNTVTMVMQTGYTLNERLLRPAMVMVSKAAAKSSVDEQA